MEHPTEPKKKFPIRRLLSVIIVAFGLGLAAYQPLRDRYMTQQESKMMQDFRDMLAEESQAAPTPEPTEGERLPKRSRSPQATPESTDATAEGSEQPGTEVPTPTSLNFTNFEDSIARWQNDSERKEYLRKYMEGILTIPKIDLEMPILRGATDFNLKVGLASLEEAGLPGQEGNYCVSGHHARAYGRQFNRLSEMATGDIVYVTDKTQVYTYEVFDIRLVKEDEMWVTEPHAEYPAILTLITCDYRIKPNGHLIVFAKLTGTRPI